MRTKLTLILLVFAWSSKAQLLQSPSPVVIGEAASFSHWSKGYTQPLSATTYDTTLGTRILAAMQRVYAKTFTLEQHGVAASVIVPGLPQWSGAVGTEDDNLPLTPSYYFEIGSCTKTFIAALILQLEDSGKLAIGDKIYQYLPTYPNVDPNITIKELLQHSSGIYDYINDDPSFTLLNEAYFTHPGTRWSADTILRNYIGPPNFRPDSTYRYSNTNYLLLGLIAEKVLGDSSPTLNGRLVSKAIHDRFLAPLGLTHTFCCWDDSIPTGFCHNWTAADTNAPSLDDYSIDKTAQLTLARTAGGMVSTPSDLARWSQALYSGELLSQPGMTEMLSFHLWSDGLQYGLGVMKVPYYAKTFCGHTGGIPGFETDMFTNPTDTVTVVLYMNSDMDSADVHPNDYLIAILNEIYRAPLDVAPNRDNIPESVCVFPNPFGNETHLTFHVNTPGPSSLSVYDALGREVRTQTDNFQSAGLQSFVLNRHGLQSGAYFFKVVLSDNQTLLGSLKLE